MIMKSRVRKPLTNMQNAHTRKTAYTFFLYFTTDLQRRPNQTDGFQNRTGPVVFLETKTELEKFILHIPSCVEYF